MGKKEENGATELVEAEKTTEEPKPAEEVKTTEQKPVEEKKTPEVKQAAVETKQPVATDPKKPEEKL